MSDVKDGSSNTIAMAETTCDFYNGYGNAWGYRGYVMTGVDPCVGSCACGVAIGINSWACYPYLTSPTPGRLGSWGQMGSLHPGGATALFADGSVQFLSETTDVIILDRMAAKSDGSVVVP